MSDKKYEELLKMVKEIQEQIQNKPESDVEELINKVREEFEQKLVEVAQKAPLVGDDIPSFSPELLKFKAADSFVERCQDVWDKALMAAQLTGKKVTETSVWKFLEKQYPTETKALATSLAGAGQELVPVGYSRRLWDELMLKLSIAGLHEVVNMPTNPYKFPVAMVDTSAFLVSESTSVNQASTEKIPASSVSTAEFTLNAKKLATRIPLSEELREDSLIDVLDLVQRRVIDAIKRAIENAIINGDDSASPIDADLTDATDPRKAFSGYRKIGAGNTVDLAGSVTAEGLMAIRAAMDKYGIDPMQLVFIVSPKTYFKLITLKDSSGNNVVVTREKYGPEATIVTGELGKVFGIPIIVSQFVREDLNASGVYDASTTGSYTAIIAVHKPSFVIGNRRELQVKIVNYVEWDQVSVSAFTRIAFGTPWANRPVVAVGVNIPV